MNQDQLNLIARDCFQSYVSALHLYFYSQPNHLSFTLSPMKHTHSQLLLITLCTVLAGCPVNEAYVCEGGCMCGCVSSSVIVNKL